MSKEVSLTQESEECVCRQKLLTVIDALDNLAEICELHGMHDEPDYIKAMDIIKRFRNDEI